ncbi:hypothetical protein B0A48_07848 [Cryoendolithus antarcticus]|uniref:Aminoglycoside phosphotransferase domain-containing protein n=1 Tax=Cryoendolithus antarcticus TaxID=1507870 RepID=A0A1V8T0P2_9PEZI|nr:hypothetical protein B0A48_07848 [Cryoendolithus antarcticus]
MGALGSSLKTLIEVLLFPIRLHLSPRIAWSAKRKVVRFSPSTLVKGPCREQELEAMLYVTRYTSVPAPRVIRVYRRMKGRDSGLWICMEFIHGKSVADVWDRVDERVRRMWVRDSMDSVKKLRRLSPPKDLGLFVASIEGGGVIDGILSEDEVGPFATVAAFRELLQSSPNLEQYRDLWDHDTKSRCVLAHADLAPRNIILRSSDGEPVIIDWEFTGWWPEYWERIKWHFADFPETTGWVEMMDALDDEG